MRIAGEMEKPHKSFRPAIQEHFYHQLQKCPCMQMSIAMCDNSNDAHGKGMRSYEWLLAQIDRLMKKDRGTLNRKK